MTSYFVGQELLVTNGALSLDSQMGGVEMSLEFSIFYIHLEII